MSVNTKELIEAVAVFAKNEDLRVTVSRNMEAAIITGVCTFVGASFGGPIGLTTGAIFGGVVCAIFYHGSLKPLHEVIRKDLNEEQKEKLKGKLINAVKEVSIVEGAVLSVIILSDDNTIKDAVLNTLRVFFKKEMGFKFI